MKIQQQATQAQTATTQQNVSTGDRSKPAEQDSSSLRRKDTEVVELSREGREVSAISERRQRERVDEQEMVDEALQDKADEKRSLANQDQSKKPTVDRMV